MTEWVGVQPLTDDDLNQRYWHEPKVGDRVRVRLNGECLVRSAPGSVCESLGLGLHATQTDGLIGRVDRVDGLQFDGHPFGVWLPPVDIGDGVWHARRMFFAASELEPAS